MKCLLNIPAAGWLLPVGEIAHNMSLCRGQIHFAQCTRYRLIRTPVQYPQQMSVMLLQIAAPSPKRSTLRIILAYPSLQRKPLIII